jgi:hypothetical protein
MAQFKRLTLDQTPAPKSDVNMDLVTYIEQNEDHSRLHFSADHFVDVKETLTQIQNINKLPNS